MKRTRSLSLVILVLCMLAAVACAAKTTSGPQVTVQRGEGAASTAKPALSDGYAGNATTDTAGKSVADERMIVRTAALSVVIKDAEASLEQVKVIVSDLKGYVVDTRMWRQDEQMRGVVTVRVPSESLDDALGRFKALAVRVESETGGSQDVTEEYSDLSAQLRNLEATETELLELLKTVREKTGKAEDILAVHRELTNIRGQIEQLKGRMQYLERTAAMASVSIELIPDVLAKPVASGGWRPAEALASALRALLGTLRFLAEALIWFAVYILPVLVILLIPFGIIWFLWKRRRAKKV